MKWVKIPCARRFSPIDLICEHHRPKHESIRNNTALDFFINDSAIGQLLFFQNRDGKLLSSDKFCPHNWLSFGAKCYFLWKRDNTSGRCHLNDSMEQRKSSLCQYDGVWQSLLHLWQGLEYDHIFECVHEFESVLPNSVLCEANLQNYTNEFEYPSGLKTKI